MIYVDKYRNIVYNIGGNRFWAYLIIRGDRYEESDTENQICFILAQATLGVCLCFFDFLERLKKTCHLFDVLVCYIY